RSSRHQMRHGRARRPRPMTHATGVDAASAGTRFCASPSAVQAPPHLAVGASAQDRDERPDLTGRWTGLFPACLGDDAWGWRLDPGPPLEAMMANLSSVLAQAAADHGERPAVRLDDLVLSYSQLRDAAGRAASLLSSL